MTPRPGKVEVPIAGEVISRRRNERRAKHGDLDDEVSGDLRTVVRLDGPAKLNWLCKAMPLVKRRKLQPSEFLDIVSSQRFAGNLDDVMPWGSQMVSMLRREIEDFQPQQVNQIMQSDLWKRFADSDDERAVTTATSSSALPAGRAAAFAAAAGSNGQAAKEQAQGAPGSLPQAAALADKATAEVTESSKQVRSTASNSSSPTPQRRAPPKAQDRPASSSSSSTSSSSGGGRGGGSSSSNSSSRSNSSSSSSSSSRGAAQKKAEAQEKQSKRRADAVKKAENSEQGSGKSKIRREDTSSKYGDRKKEHKPKRHPEHGHDRGSNGEVTVSSKSTRKDKEGRLKPKKDSSPSQREANGKGKRHAVKKGGRDEGRGREGDGKSAESREASERAEAQKAVKKRRKHDEAEKASRKKPKRAHSSRSREDRPDESRKSKTREGAVGGAHEEEVGESVGENGKRDGGARAAAPSDSDTDIVVARERIQKKKKKRKAQSGDGKERGHKPAAARGHARDTGAKAEGGRKGKGGRSPPPLAGTSGRS